MGFFNFGVPFSPEIRTYDSFPNCAIVKVNDRKSNFPVCLGKYSYCTKLFYLIL